MRSVGIDLAWGRKNTTACVCLSDESGACKVQAHDRALFTDADIVDFVLQNQGDSGCIVAIDAPTLVTNETGQRPCEAQCQALFAKYHAGPHPANRSLYKGDIRGELLVAELGTLGYSHDPAPPKNGEKRVMEVFPHPAHVSLFGLKRTLKYKSKPGRTLDNRLGEFARYSKYLRELETADPPLFVADEMLALPNTVTPKMLKQYEDGLDALTCAYVAAYYLRWGEQRVQVLGDMQTGHIVVPRLLEAPTQMLYVISTGVRNERSGENTSLSVVG